MPRTVTRPADPVRHLDDCPRGRQETFAVAGRDGKGRPGTYRTTRCIDCGESDTERVGAERPAPTFEIDTDIEFKEGQ